MSKFLGNSIFFGFLFIGLAVLLVAKSSHNEQFQFSTCPLEGELNIVMTSETSAALSWTVISGTVPYTVKVYNLTSHTLEQSFQVNDTFTSVSNLNTGDTYRFSVEKGANIIIVEIIAG